MSTNPLFVEHQIQSEHGMIYARDYSGVEPAFVLMHGFPDNLGIYDDLVPHLVEAGRRVVTFDFLGFGSSEKRAGAPYSFARQRGDLEAVVAHLGLGAVALVPHDSSGIAAINFAIEHPDKTASLNILNSAYDASPLATWPEMIALFAEPSLRALAGAVAQSPAQFGWVLTWQQQRFVDALPADQQPHFRDVPGPLIAANFTVQPSSGPAFMQLAAEFYAELRRNSARLPLAAALDLPVKVIWGEHDPYFSAAFGQERASLFRNATFHPVAAGHWLQSDRPDLVAALLLA